MEQTVQARRLHPADPSGAHPVLSEQVRRFREASDGSLDRAGAAGSGSSRHRGNGGSNRSGADHPWDPALRNRSALAGLLAVVVLGVGCATAPSGYAGGVVVAPIASCDRLMSEAQVWLVRNGAANGITGVQTATTVAVQTARPASDTSAEVFVSVTRSDQADATCRIDVSADTWNPLSVNRALRIEDALAKHLRALAQ